MKITVVLLVAVLALGTTAQMRLAAAMDAPTIVERGPHHRVLEWSEVDEQGQTNIHSFTELATGLHFVNPATGEYEESVAAFEISADGHAIASKGQHQVILTPDINAPSSVDLLIPDGQRLRSNPMGLSYFDTSTGQNVLVAEVTNCVGELIAPNVIVYPDAFDTLKAALRYTYTRDGFSQDIIIYENPGDPAAYGLNPATTRLEMYSEFFNPPTPGKTTQTINEGLQDEALSFGAFQIGRGKTYFLGDELEAADVGKSWTRIENRDWLIESVPYTQIQAMLQKLEQRVAQASELSRTDRKGLVAGLRKREKSKDVASIRPGRMSQQRGIVIDYTTLNTSQTDYIFKGDTTYFIGGNVSLNGTKTTFEGGTVLKYTNNVTLTVNTPVTWEGSAYRPVVLTARDNQSVGESITPTNALSGYYATTALYFDADTAASSLGLQNLRVTHAKNAVGIKGRAGHLLSHVQLLNCENGIAATNAEFSLRNALAHNVLTNFTGSSSTGRVEHLTVNIATWLNKDIGSNLYLTNCLLVGVTNGGSFSSNSVVTASGSVFQTLGQGYHYLASGSAYRNAGTTTINATLASQLKKLTTYPPIELTSDFTISTTLSPQAGRDSDTPDLGWHYDPLDYVWSTRNLTNSSTLTLTNGVAIGIYGAKGTTIRSGGKIVSEGTPINLNRLVRYHAVQEQPVVWGTTGNSHSLIDFSGATPDVRLRFTDASLMADTVSKRLLAAGLGGGVYNPFSVAHSQLRGVYMDVYAYSSGMVLILTNNWFHRSRLSCYQENISGYTSFTLHLYNNLFHRGTVSFTEVSSFGTWTVKDNLFDSDSVSVSGSFTASHNGFRSGLTSFGTNKKTGLTMNYEAGPLGAFYYPTNGATNTLTALIDAGSRSSTTSGLYHFTTAANQAKEASTTVDIGYHYVAVDGNVLPLDTDGDGLADYFEDRDGDGTADAGETNWQNSENGTTGVPGLQVFTVLE